MYHRSGKVAPLEIERSLPQFIAFSQVPLYASLPFQASQCKPCLTALLAPSHQLSHSHSPVQGPQGRSYLRKHFYHRQWHLDIDAAAERGLVSFAFVRHPFSRLASAYYNKMVVGDWGNRTGALRSGENFTILCTTLFVLKATVVSINAPNESGTP